MEEQLTPTPAPVPQKTNHWLWIGMCVLMLFLGISIGVVLARYLYQKPTTTLTDSSTPTPTIDPTANWKTYTNTKYGFTFKYPPSWKYLEAPTPVYQTPNNEVWLTHSEFPQPQTDARSDIVFILTSSDPSTNWQPQYFNNYELVNYPLGIVAAKKITGINKEGLNQELVVVAKIGNSYLQVLSNYGEESSKYFDQILSTFKFLDQEPTKCVQIDDPCHPQACNYDPAKCDK